MRKNKGEATAEVDPTAESGAGSPREATEVDHTAEPAAGSQRAAAEIDHTAESTGSRRAAGALESAILGVLWSAEQPLSPGEVRERLARGSDAETAAGAGLSYSTVVTILTRLHDKRALTRVRDGRAFRYAPVSDEAGLAARRLSQLLDRAPNREAVLSRFVEDLSERDEQLLRELLGGGPHGGTAP
jgi:predicted transcriptional regulator